MSDVNKKLVADFFATWSGSFDGLLDGFSTAMSDDCVLEQTRTPTLRGLPDILAFMHAVRGAGVFETIDVEVVRLISDGRFVVSERIDTLRQAGGRATSTFPCVGVMEIREGKIVGWHDYFDSADMQAGGMEVVQAQPAS